MANSTSIPPPKEELVARRRSVLGGANLRLFFDPNPLQLVRGDGAPKRKEKRKEQKAQTLSFFFFFFFFFSLFKRMFSY